MLFLLFLLSDDGSLPFLFLFFVYYLPTAACLFIFFLVLGQSSSPCLEQLHKLTSSLVSGRTLLFASAEIKGLRSVQHN